jgi:prepilin-type N-terminal cleavage/methylation domain-containing protein
LSSGELKNFFMAKKALTLVEMVIALAITAVLTTTTLVTLNFVDGRDLDTQSRNMVTDLIWARELAASRHNNYIVVFNTTSETCSFYNNSIAPANLIRKQKLTVNLASVTDWSLNPITSVTFYFPKGSASVSALVNLLQTGRSRRVNITDETGFIRLE